MEAIRTTVDNFLKKYHMDQELPDPEKCAADFQKEMIAGLHGEPSTLFMLPTFLSVNTAIPYEEPVIVVDAGGTNFRCAIVTLHENRKPTISNFQKSYMPGTKGQLSKEEFYKEVVDRIEPVLQGGNKMGFIFSFPVEIFPNKDGRLLHFTKEVDAPQVHGTFLGAEVNKELKRRGKEPKDIVVLNDTVAALFGGLTGQNPKEYKKNIGLIFGTGLNTCYPEATKSITKSPEASKTTGQMLINMESGGFGGFPQGALDDDFDLTTVAPCDFKFEKMVSGAYFGGVLHFVVKKAMEEGLFSPDFSTAYSYTEEIFLWDADNFFNQPSGKNTLASLCHTEEDRQALHYLIESMWRRSAKLIAIHLAGILNQMGHSSTKENPYVITAEGTTFEKTAVFRKHLDAYMDSIVRDRYGHYTRFQTMEDVTLVGAAVAGLVG